MESPTSGICSSRQAICQTPRPDPLDLEVVDGPARVTGPREPTGAEVVVGRGPQRGRHGAGLGVEQLLDDAGAVGQVRVVGHRSPAAASPARKPKTRAGPSVAPPAGVAVPNGLAATLPAA